MTRTSTQPTTFYSRDLKYMLDSKHAAAPVRRSRPKTLLAAVVSGALAVSVWAGTRTLEGAADTPRTAVADAPTAAAPEGIGPDREYTQPGQQLAKADPVYRTRRINPHPPRMGDVKPLIDWKAYSVQRGDSLGRIFSRFSINIGLASRIVEHETASQLKKLMPGHEMSLGFNADGALVGLRYQLSRMEQLVVRLREGELLAAEERQLPAETRERSASMSIGSSLFGAAAKAGLSDRLVMELVSIFGWDIDFALDIRTGDHFTVLYEELVRDGSVIGTGDIIAAEFINDGNTYHAVRHVDDSGRKRYYDLDGNNLRGTFLRTPMKVSRVTSGFSKRRYHPVLKKWRAHKGVDYGAPTGTPVLATGDGRIHSIGRKGGYGNAIVLKHGGQYSTLYAHLSGFKQGLKRGARVSQGEVIGYVGATGMVTGPHLHYEFRVNGQHRDPLAFETPRAEPIAERYREEFLAMARSRINQLADMRPEQVASR